MKLKMMLASTALMFLAAPQVHADQFDINCSMTPKQQAMVASVALALESVNFSECRIDINDRGMSFDHGALHGWVGFDSEYVDVTNAGNAIVATDTHFDPESDIDRLQDKIVFNVSTDHKRIVSVDFVRSEESPANSGTIGNPNFSTVYTPIDSVHCTAN